MSLCCTDFEAAEFYRENMRNAAKKHTCCECNSLIQPGDEYQYISGKWEGTFYTFKSCEKCADLRDSLNNIWCVALGDLRFEYKEYLDNSQSYYDEETDKYVYPENHMKLNKDK